MRLDLLVNDFVYRAVHDRAVLIFEGTSSELHPYSRCCARVHSRVGAFEKMKGKPYNAGLEEANLSKLELCAVIKKHLPKFVYVEAPIGEDPDKRDYIVSNQRLLGTASRRMGAGPRHRGTDQGFTILRNSIYSNV